MKRFFASALAGALALGSLAAPALANGNGHGNGHGGAHDRGATHRTAAHAQRQTGTVYQPGTPGTVYPNNGAPYNYGNAADQGPHGCINPAGHVRGWCKNGNATSNGVYNGNYNGFPNTNGAANQQVSGIVTAVSGNRVTILIGLRSLNIDTSQAYRNGGAYNVGIGSTITAYGYYGSNNTFYATQITS